MSEARNYEKLCITTNNEERRLAELEKDSSIKEYAQLKVLVGNLVKALIY